MYWENLFSEENLKDICLKFNGEAELFWRKASLDSEKVTHHKKGSILVNNTDLEIITSEIQNQISFDALFKMIPETFKNIDINTIELLDDNQKLLCAKLMAILADKSNRGLYIYGDLGVGKTYECIALANALVKKGKKVAVIKSASFINEMRQTVTIDSSLFNEKMNKIKKCEYLFVDDIGTESVSSFSRDDVLFDILDYRMENKLCTIFTSNLDKESLKKHYTYDKKDNSNLMRAKRLVERIDILGEDFALVGENKRR